MVLINKILKDVAIFFKLLNIKKHKKFKIIPMGTYCLPRTIATIAGIKPKKKDGEKSLPFDLAFFRDLDIIATLINTDFENFFDNIEFNNKLNCWENKELQAVFLHDGNLPKEDFILRYKKRIANLYEYLSDKTFHAYILIANDKPTSEKQLNTIKNSILRFRNTDEFDIILINQSEEINNVKEDNLFVINQNENCKIFKTINKNGGWASHLKKRNTKIAQKIYYEIVYGVLNIIK